MAYHGAFKDRGYIFQIQTGMTKRPVWQNKTDTLKSIRFVL
jgi:hypothetical protein